MKKGNGHAGRRRATSADPAGSRTLPATAQPYSILVTGVGGTGVVTIGALIGMAAHIDGKGVTVLDMTGLAQKGGAVFSHVRIADRPEDIHAARIATGEADAVIGGDMVVSAGTEALSQDARRAHARRGQLQRNADRRLHPQPATGSSRWRACRQH